MRGLPLDLVVAVTSPAVASGSADELGRAVGAVEALGAAWGHQELDVDHLVLAVLACQRGARLVAASTDLRWLEHVLDRRLHRRRRRQVRRPEWSDRARDARRVAERFARRRGRLPHAVDLLGGVLEVGTELHGVRALLGRIVPAFEEEPSWLESLGLHGAITGGAQRHGLDEAYRIVVHNDPRTSMELVVSVLVDELALPVPTATRLMLHAHRHGWATLGIHDPATATRKVDAAIDRVVDAGAPLRLSADPIPALDAPGEGPCLLRLGCRPGVEPAVVARGLSDVLGITTSVALRAALGAAETGESPLARAEVAAATRHALAVAGWAEAHALEVSLRVDGPTA